MGLAPAVSRKGEEALLLQDGQGGTQGGAADLKLIHEKPFTGKDALHPGAFLDRLTQYVGCGLDQ